MTPPPALFEAHFTPESMHVAGLAFRDYLFKRYGLLLSAACAINVAALAFVLWTGAAQGPALYLLVFVVVFCPVWLLFRFYFAGPYLQSQRLRRILAVRGNVSVSDDFVVLPRHNGGEIPFAWSKTKVVEHASLFLLVPSPFFVYYVPKMGMPAVVEHVFRTKSARSAA
jgi:hypothetical protein